MLCSLQGDFVTTDGSEYALKEAIFTKGPMTVSVDAAPDSFVFYSSGIYNNSACKSDYDGRSSTTIHVCNILSAIYCLQYRYAIIVFCAALSYPARCYCKQDSNMTDGRSLVLLCPALACSAVPLLAQPGPALSSPTLPWIFSAFC